MMYFDDAICWKFQVIENFSVWCYLVLDSFMNLNVILFLLIQVLKCGICYFYFKILEFK